MNLQPLTLANEWVTLIPLKDTDFDILYQIASDPLIWEQHPSKLRYQKNVFEIFFKGAIESNGAFIITDTKTGIPIGSTRFYHLNTITNSIQIGYTFFARSCWGKPYNRSTKSLMINYAFQHVEMVQFDIGALNIRSQKAIEKIGAVKVRAEEIQYVGEVATLNFVYTIQKNNWNNDLIF